MAEGKVKKGDGKDVDHRNGNAHDNSKSNLRVQSKSQNSKLLGCIFANSVFEGIVATVIILNLQYGFPNMLSVV